MSRLRQYRPARFSQNRCCGRRHFGHDDLRTTTFERCFGARLDRAR